MALPLGTTGSLSPTFVPARLVGLAVKLPYAFALFERFPTTLREPLGASVTFRRRPPQSNCPPDTVPRPVSGYQVRTPIRSGWYPNVDSTQAGAHASKSPTYPVQIVPKSNIKLQ